MSQTALSEMAHLRLQHFEEATDGADCRATAEMSEKLNPTDRTSLYDIACMRAVTAAALCAKDKSGTADRAAAADMQQNLGQTRPAPGMRRESIQPIFCSDAMAVTATDGTS